MSKVKSGLSALLCSTLCLTLSTQAEAKTLFSKTFSYFSIGGMTAEDLDRELSSKGPFASSTGSRHPGETQIKFSGSAQYLEKKGSCRIQDAQVKVVSKIFLPTWKNRNRASPDLRLIWDALASDIKRHEERHAEIALQHARMLEIDHQVPSRRKDMCGDAGRSRESDRHRNRQSRPGSATI